MPVAIERSRESNQWFPYGQSIGAFTIKPPRLIQHIFIYNDIIQEFAANRPDSRSAVIPVYNFGKAVEFLRGRNLVAAIR